MHLTYFGKSWYDFCIIKNINILTDYNHLVELIENIHNQCIPKKKL